MSVSWSSLFRGENGVTTLVLIQGVVLHAINVFIATALLPTAVNDIGGMSFYAWNTTGFIVASIIAAVIAASFLERLSPQGHIWLPH
ncbi:hypothetical protein [Pseudaminobacter salicylatoxidans]|uniref:hypothetical protein n=1 Tax=Pseudaminobacter salicylatoxidans TaxID=93369 RepID=UPI0002FB596A|nr:hypothetical protein [Pseudaminobacter salicylatoxidans]